MRLAREHAAAGEAEAALPRAVVERLIALGLFKLWVPRRYGGLELDLPRTLELYERAAHADGAVGWAVMIGTGAGLFAAWVEPETAEEMYARRDAVIAGSGVPEGRAERVPGGYRCTGRWRYASGANYATTFTANCIVTEGGAPVMRDGAPLVRAMAFEPAAVTIHRTWDATGMRATASHDMEVRDVFVPERRTFSVLTDPPREPGPLYRLPFVVLTELPVASVALGIARHALEAFAALARTKRGYGGTGPLAEEPYVRVCFAQSRARLTFARAGIQAMAARAWEAALANRPLAPAERGEITAAAVHCVAECLAAVGALITPAGMTPLARDDELGRAWRDLQALAAHGSISPRGLAAAGAGLLGGA
ncbi:MAG TPA: acyl-CoA dehydrogenase family protein [Gammaproteobacteria bacterium]